ncbi:hypothetical protein J1605_005557 [Eschrichtius robustus]|uniref:Uncharacterized protein n=1 Tax=Eschrichtius robustus TaxID=9764 RepID=A0AB34H895_ESCRO|nr:hypothetical protein J1605_005557 [Eschrichtius robustus]
MAGKEVQPYFITRVALDPVPCAVLCPSAVLTDTSVTWTALSPHRQGTEVPERRRRWVGTAVVPEPGRVLCPAAAEGHRLRVSVVGSPPRPSPNPVSTVGLLPMPDGPSGHVMCRGRHVKTGQLAAIKVMDVTESVINEVPCAWTDRGPSRRASVHASVQVAGGVAGACCRLTVIRTRLTRLLPDVGYHFKRHLWEFCDAFASPES